MIDVNGVEIIFNQLYQNNPTMQAYTRLMQQHAVQTYNIGDRVKYRNPSSRAVTNYGTVIQLNQLNTNGNIQYPVICWDGDGNDKFWRTDSYNIDHISKLDSTKEINQIVDAVFANYYEEAVKERYVEGQQKAQLGTKVAA